MAVDSVVSVIPDQSDEPPNLNSAADGDSDGDVKINEAQFRCFTFPPDLVLPLIRSHTDTDTETETHASTDDSRTLVEYQSVVQVMHQLDNLWLRESVISIDSSKFSQQPTRKPYCSSNIVELTEPFQWSKPSSASGHDQASRGSETSDYIPPPRFSPISSRKSLKPVKERTSKMKPMNQKFAVQISLSGTDKDCKQCASKRDSQLLTRRQVCSKTPADTLIVTLHSAKLHDCGDGDLENRLKDFKRIDHGAGLDLAVQRANNGLTSEVNECAQGDAHQVQPHHGNNKPRARVWRRTSSKSMTAIEFQEIQGFMDLGFNFGKEEVTPRLVNMLPH